MGKHNHIYGTAGCVECQKENELTEELNESEHNDSLTLTKKINEIIRKLKK